MFMNDALSRIVWRMFPFFERFGVHVLPVHYYSPIPDTRKLKQRTELFDIPHSMTGVDLRPDEQLNFVRDVIVPYEDEYRRVGAGRFGTDERSMLSFAPFNALTLYAMIRHFRPKRVIEVGSGLSTKISAAALTRNQTEGSPGTLTAIEPYPSAELQQGFSGLTHLVMKKVEDVPVQLFRELTTHDILFIDSSHTVKIFGDVNYLFFTVMPELQPGVLIHVHDIFFPLNYLPHHFFNLRNKQIWQEQYLLHAFLMYNSDFRVLLSSSWLHYHFMAQLKEVLPWYHATRWPSSFWMTRVGGTLR
jgi:predicted O-methyltransferase YrrM